MSNFTSEQIRLLCKCFEALDDTISLEDLAEGFDISIEEALALREAVAKYRAE